MPDMTPAEALAIALDISDHHVDSDAIARLRALGFAIVPVEADEAAIERGALAILHAANFNGADNADQLSRQFDIVAGRWSELSDDDLDDNDGERGCTIYGRNYYREGARAAYAAMVAPDAEKGKS